MDLGPEQIRHIVTVMVVLIASIGLHEFGHAFVADRLGDDTPRRQGRVTLNPLAHADPIGTFALPLAALVLTGGRSTGFGWGRPVEVQGRNFTRRFHMSTSHAFVAAAGPLMNLLLGTVVATLHVALIATDVLHPGDAIHAGLGTAVILNYSLFIFNLLPAPPLDGGWILARLVPTRYRRQYEQYAVYAPFVVMAFIMIGPLSKVITIPALFLVKNVYHLLTLAFGVLPLFP